MRQLADEVPGESKTVKISNVRERCRRSGLTSAEEVDRFLDQYEDQNIWLINQNRTKLTMVSIGDQRD